MAHDPRGPDRERPHIWFKGGAWCYCWAKTDSKDRKRRLLIRERNFLAGFYTARMQERHDQQRLQEIRNDSGN